MLRSDNVVFVDYRIDDEEKQTLIDSGFNPVLCPRCDLLYEAINGHPDVQISIIDSNTILCHKDISKDFLRTVEELGIKVEFTYSSLSSQYPYDIILNAVNYHNIFIHNFKYTDSKLKEMTVSSARDKEISIDIINVNQGYAKCSTAIVTDSAFMTTDISIAKALENKGYDVLFLPTGDIILQGFDYGFIGGCCGLLKKDLIAFYGDLNYYSYGQEVMDFLKKHNVSWLFLKRDKLHDRGSILSLM